MTIAIIESKDTHKDNNTLCVIVFVYVLVLSFKDRFVFCLCNCFLWTFPKMEIPARKSPLRIWNPSRNPTFLIWRWRIAITKIKKVGL